MTRSNDLAAALLGPLDVAIGISHTGRAEVTRR